MFIFGCRWLWRIALIEWLYDGSSPAAVTIISISIVLVFGFLTTRITKRLRLPNVTAYIAAGIVIGPFCLNLIPAGFIENTSFLSDVALAFIAFNTGEFFKVETLRKNGAKVTVITLFEALIASFCVFLLTFCVLRLNLAFCLVLSALASTTAPASTLMTIRQTGARGDFVETLLQVVALDDIVGLFAYSVAISVAVLGVSGSDFSFSRVARPIFTNILVLLLGCAFGLLLKFMLRPKTRSTDNRLIISVALIFTFCGFCTIFEVSPLLGCMSMGATYINSTSDEKLFRQLNYFSPPILLMFFVRSGMAFDLSSLLGGSGSIGESPLILIGVLYFLVRIAGKYSGAFLGCLAAKKPRETRNFLGLALIPQAGVAIGLAEMGARTISGEAGDALRTIILSSSILYELIGPACAKAALYLSKSYSTRLEDLVVVQETDGKGQEKTPLELLIERIQKIQEELPTHTVNEDEAAYTEAAESQHDALWSGVDMRRGRK